VYYIYIYVYPHTHAHGLATGRLLEEEAARGDSTWDDDGNDDGARMEREQR